MIFSFYIKRNYLKKKIKKKMSDDEEEAIKRVNEEKEVLQSETYVKVIQLLIGIGELVILVIIITTWIFEYEHTPKMVLISLFQIPLIFAMIFSLFVIPINFKYWFIGGNSWKEKGRKVMMTYLMIQSISMFCLFGDVIWRCVVYQTPCSKFFTG